MRTKRISKKKPKRKLTIVIKTQIEMHNDIRYLLLEKNKKKERNIIINLNNNDFLEKDIEEAKNIIINNLSYKEYNNINMIH